MVEGLFLVGKPVGITSHDVVDRLRAIVNESKIGHAGTLDPLASGLLIVAIGRSATKQLNKFKDLDKEYEAVAALGKISTTYDREGEIKEISQAQPRLEKIKQTLVSFRGTYDQMPPIFSAKKVGGKTAYSLARTGQEVDLKPGQVTIFSIELLGYKYPELSFRAVVSPGTYIRSLTHDIGRRLKTGAYLIKLRRTKIGNYQLSDALAVDDIKSAADLDSVKIG